MDIKGKFTLFADDTTILWQSDSAQSLNEMVSSDLLQVKGWFDSNLLALNVEKTNILGFKCDMSGLSIGDCSLLNLSHTKFLGLDVDRDLKFGPHITTLSKKIASGCYAVRTVSRELGLLTAKSVYYALVESRLRYGIAFWGMCSQGLLNIIFVLQKRALRSLYHIGHRESCRPFFISGKILTLVSIFILETVILMFKNREKFMDPDPYYATRRSMDIPLPIPTSTLTKRSIIYESKKIFNHLPVTIKQEQSLKLFRKKVKMLLVGKAYYTLTEYYCDNL